MLPDIGVFLFLCAVLWLGTGLIVSTIDRFARTVRISAFSLSFFILGLVTSIPEIAVGANSVIQGTPEVFVGNLLGGVPIIFLLIIPLLAIFGNGVRMSQEMSPYKLLITFVVISAPAFFVLDRAVTNPEGVMLVFLYLFLFILLEQKKGGILGATRPKVKSTVKKSRGAVAVKILFGTLLVLVSAHFLLEKTIYFAQQLGILPFYVSLIALSLGTNIPELSLAVRSVLQGKKDIALGDYLGSASANTVLFGIFTLLTPAETFNVNNSWITFGFIVGGLALFYHFYQSKRTISRTEGLILLSAYVLFCILELRHV
jgi:cation:H+ antiporter